MPYAIHNRIVFGGNLGTNTPAPEAWSCSINMAQPGTPSTTTAPTVALATQYWNAWNTNLMARITVIGAAVSLEYVKVSRINVDGKVLGAVFRYDAHSQSGGTANQNPYQSCMVVSLRTGQRGPSKRGRFYVPALAAVTRIEDGQVSETTRDSLQDGAKAMLLAMQLAGDGLDKVMVASSAGYNTQVTGITVGKVVDTQRRRRRSLEENYGPEIPLAPA